MAKWHIVRITTFTLTSLHKLSDFSSLCKPHGCIMVSNRHINVFYKSDGKCVLDKKWDSETTNTLPHATEQTQISSETLWPLLQVFVQFAREVQGGTVKRLVFRNPEEFSPTVQRFQPVPQRRKEKHPVIVHVAHDELFVVAVTEFLEKEWGSLRLMTEGEQAAGITIAEFCESVLDHLNREQTCFVATLEGGNLGRQMSPDNRTEAWQAESSTSATTTEYTGNAARADHSESQRGQTGPPPTTSGQPVVKINEQRLLEYISKTQNLLFLTDTQKNRHRDTELAAKDARFVY